MARMNEEGQWIVLMGLLVAVGLFFLALIINQSVLVGQTTAEGVLEFSKNDIHDLRREILDCYDLYPVDDPTGKEEYQDIVRISLERKGTVVHVESGARLDVSGHWLREVTIHYNNGVTEYDETLYY